MQWKLIYSDPLAIEQWKIETSQVYGLTILLVMKFVAAQMKNHWIEYHIALLSTKEIGHRW